MLYVATLYRLSLCVFIFSCSLYFFVSPSQSYFQSLMCDRFPTPCVFIFFYYLIYLYLYNICYYIYIQIEIVIYLMKRLYALCC
jgi:hypothetical protein